MPERRLRATRAAYRCNRQMIIVAWPHCQCRGCFFARRVVDFMRLPMDWKGGQWFTDAEADIDSPHVITDPKV